MDSPSISDKKKSLIQHSANKADNRSYSQKEANALRATLGLGYVNNIEQTSKPKKPTNTKTK